MEMTWDCVVVGGGAAGLSAALVLGRARRRTLCVDAGGQSNRFAEGVGGLLGHDGRPPGELYEMGRREVSAYPSVQLLTGEVVRGERVNGGFALELAGGGRELTRRVLLATGMDYQRRDLPGLDELWGRSVFHCPFCHGWEMRDRPLAVLANGEAARHGALLLRGWSDDVVLLTDGPAELAPADRERLARAAVAIDERPVAGLVAREGRLAAVAFAGGGEIAREGLLMPVRLRQRSSLAAQLGIQAADPSPMVVDPLGVDAQQRTSVPGVFAAGDLTTMPQVAAAIASGSLAAAAVVQSLVAEDHGLAPPLEAAAASRD
jgi:thioredoxin reductase